MSKTNNIYIRTLDGSLLCEFSWTLAPRDYGRDPDCLRPARHLCPNRSSRCSELVDLDNLSVDSGIGLEMFLQESTQEA